MKIRTRLTLYFTILVVALISLRSAYTYYSLKNFSNEEFYKQLYSKALSYAHFLTQVQQIDSALLNTIDRRQYDVTKGENITLYDESNRIIYTTNDTAFDKSSFALMLDDIRREKMKRYRVGRYKILGLLHEENARKITVVAGAIDAEGEAMLLKLQSVQLFMLFVSVIATALLGWFFVGGALAPISAVIKQVKNISPVERSERLPEPRGRDEIAQLIQTFNNFFDKLEDSYTLEKNFAGNVSHELYNPLTKIKSQIEVCLIQNRDVESYKFTLNSVLEDVNELANLVHNLLTFTKFASQSFVSKTPLRIDELLFELRDNTKALFPNYHINIDFANLPKTEGPLVFHANKPLITLALKNIIENACKYSPDYTAEIKFTLGENLIVVAVSDKGPGISEYDLPHIFEPFYRSPNMRNVKGYGIGLAMSQRIFKAHGFPLTVESKTGEGTTFSVSFSK